MKLEPFALQERPPKAGKSGGSIIGLGRSKGR